MAELELELYFAPKPQPEKRNPFPGEIPLFDWYDVVHIYPESYLPKEEQTARKLRRLRRLERSPTPEIVQQIGAVMNWFDDIEDFLVTCGTLLRFIIPKIAPKFLPYVGLVFLLADIINLFQVWRLVMPSKTLGKTEQWKLKELNPFGTIARSRRQARLIRRVPVIGEWLEILQTTDNLFGIGISFGPLIGAFEDVLFGIIHQGQTLWENYVQTDPVIESMLLLIGSIGMYPAIDELDAEEFLHYAVATSYAYSILRWFYEVADIEKTETHLGLEITPRPVRNPITAKVLQDNGYDPKQAWKWPIRRPASKMKVPDLTIEHPSLISFKWQNKIKEQPTMQTDWFLGGIMVQIARDFWAMANGEPTDLILQPTLETSIMLRQTEEGISPYLLDNTEDWSLLRNAIERFQKENGRWPTKDDYVKFATASQKEYMITDQPMLHIQADQFDFLQPTKGKPDPIHDKLIVVEEMNIPLFLP
ncbi:MAG: hypothetical protein WBC70_17300 [Candidatus Aminicenantales bacterium]